LSHWRRERLADEIREVMARLLTSELKDPRIGFVTVTRVEMTSDLETAKVLVGVLGSEQERAKTMKALAQATGFARRALGRAIRLRRVPELVFEYDRGLDAADRVAQLLEEDKRRDAGGGGDPEA
jgi:ribosome-binding factor A